MLSLSKTSSCQAPPPASATSPAIFTKWHGDYVDYTECKSPCAEPHRAAQDFSFLANATRCYYEILEKGVPEQYEYTDEKYFLSGSFGLKKDDGDQCRLYFSPNINQPNEEEGLFSAPYLYSFIGGKTLFYGYPFDKSLKEQCNNISSEVTVTGRIFTGKINIKNVVKEDVKFILKGNHLSEINIYYKNKISEIVQIVAWGKDSQGEFIKKFVRKSYDHDGKLTSQEMNTLVERKNVKDAMRLKHPFAHYSHVDDFRLKGQSSNAVDYEMAQHPADPITLDHLQRIKDRHDRETLQSNMTMWAIAFIIGAGILSIPYQWHRRHL
jgi:hypothetical protein